MRLVVASENPTKLQAAQVAFSQVFPEETFEILPIKATSGVADQPMTSEETYTGARNRLQHAKQQLPGADRYISIEGGLEPSDHGLMCCARVLVENAAGRLGKARTSMFLLPPEVIELIHQGIELGYAADQVFNTHNIKHSKGIVGILTDDHIDRTRYYSDPLILALIPFLHPEIY